MYKKINLRMSFIISMVLLSLNVILLAYGDYSGNVSNHEAPTNDRSPRDVQLQECSRTITISSSGISNSVQGSVLGTYFIETRMIMKWPTWKMKCRDDRYLYRCPCGKQGWLFGKWNGNDVGWIKHPNCTECPENCSRDWLYWNDDLKQWYPDTQLHVTKDDRSEECIPSFWGILRHLPVWTIIATVISILMAMTFSVAIPCIYFYKKKRVPIWVIISAALSCFLIVIILGTRSESPQLANRQYYNHHL